MDVREMLGGWLLSAYEETVPSEPEETEPTESEAET